MPFEISLDVSVTEKMSTSCLLYNINIHFMYDL